jgi:hypothetical protein
MTLYKLRTKVMLYMRYSQKIVTASISLQGVATDGFLGRFELSFASGLNRVDLEASPLQDCKIARLQDCISLQASGQKGARAGWFMR